MITRSRKSSIQKPAPFIASDQLTEDHVHGQKASKKSRGNQTVQTKEQARVPNGTQVRDAIITEDDVSSETESESIEKNIEDSISEKARKVRGKNKNKTILALKDGEKLEIQFYNNRGVGPNHKCWSRHLGKIVRDKHICPIRVHTWKEMPDLNKQHMWDWVKEYFFNPKMELYREHTLEHMGALWTAWRSSLNTKYFKPCKTKELSLKNVPPGMDVKDWEWLVTERFLSDEFQEISARNSNNRVNGVMPHRSGSQPHRQIIYEMGGKVDTPADVAKIFYATRQKNGKLVDTRDQEKYDEIIKTVRADASLEPIEVVETCFGPQSHKVFGFGGGIKRKHFNDKKGKKKKLCNEPEATYIKELEATYIKELEAKLHEKDEENNSLIRRIEAIERRLSRMENDNKSSSSDPSTCGDGLE